MFTLMFRPLRSPQTGPTHQLDQIVTELSEALTDLLDAQVIATVKPVLLEKNLEVARHLRWHTHGSRNRLVLETTWHHRQSTLIIDAHQAANDCHRHTALFVLMQQAARAGYTWAGAWWEAGDTVAEPLGFYEPASWHDEGAPLPALGRRQLEGDLVLEWLRPSLRNMKRLIYFAEDCRIDWESLIVEDLMTDTPAAYLELRQGRNTAALARVLVERYLPGMEGYDPRRKRPPVRVEIESLEAHPDHQGQGYGTILVEAIQGLQRPVSTLDTYRRAEPFWERMQFRRNAHRSSREDSNIFEWAPRLGRPQRREYAAAGVPADENR